LACVAGLGFVGCGVAMQDPTQLPTIEIGIKPLEVDVQLNVFFKILIKIIFKFLYRKTPDKS
jgi:hypothetical protein